MPTRTMAVLAVAASLLLGAQAMAQVPHFQSGQVLTADELNRIVEELNQVVERFNESLDRSPVTHLVSCPSESIADTMAQARPGDTIRVTGECVENVVVDKDRITLDGGDSAVIDGMDSGGNKSGSVIAVVGQQNVTIKGLTVKNGEHGVYIADNANAKLDEVTISENVSGAVILNNSGIHVIDCVIEDNEEDGVFARNNGTVNIEDITVRNNGGDGIAAYNNSFVLAYMDPGSNITGNTRGIYATNGAGVDVSNALITGNQDFDVVAQFAARMTFTGSAMDTESCDDTALIEGITCPQ